MLRWLNERDDRKLSNTIKLNKAWKVQPFKTALYKWQHRLEYKAIKYFHGIKFMYSETIESQSDYIFDFQQLNYDHQALIYSKPICRYFFPKQGNWTSGYTKEARKRWSFCVNIHHKSSITTGGCFTQGVHNRWLFQNTSFHQDNSIYS